MPLKQSIDQKINKTNEGSTWIKLDHFQHNIKVWTNWEAYHVLGWEDLIMKRLITFKAIYTFHTIPIKIPPWIFLGTGHNDLELQLEEKKNLKNNKGMYPKE